VDTTHRFLKSLLLRGSQERELDDGMHINRKRVFASRMEPSEEENDNDQSYQVWLEGWHIRPACEHASCEV
jgi:hypothetical protein